MFDNLFPIIWSDFHFLRPHFLWLLLPVIVLTLLSLLSLRQEASWKKVIAPHLRPFVIKKGSNTVKIVMHVILLLVFALAIAGLAGPTWKRVDIPGKKMETPMVILLDLSQSMMAEDIQPNRLERAKFKVKDLIKENPQARMALVAFAGTAHTVVPLTKDYDIIKDHVEGLKPSTMPYPGSDLEAGLQVTDTITNITDAPGTIIILSDDFDTTERDALSNYVKNSKDKIVILPLNTANGAEVPNFYGKQPLKDQAGHPVYSSLNQTVLNSLNAMDGITVQPLTLDNSDVEVIAKNISDHLVFTTKAKEKENTWRDAGLLCILPAAFLFLFWFRKGWVLYSLLLVMMTSCGEDQKFADLWMTKDYQGQRLSNQQKYEEAGHEFKNPMRKGVAYYKAGDYEQAISAFSNDTTAHGVYNLGLAYFKNGDTLAAQAAFKQAIEQEPDLQAAQKNLNEIEKLLPGTSEMSLKEAQEQHDKPLANMEQNKSMEDLSGGGQKATKKDMEKKRLEENVNTDIRKGKELDEVPDDIDLDNTKQDHTKVLMQKVDDDPALFIKKKFAYQVKKYKIKPKSNEKKW